MNNTTIRSAQEDPILGTDSVLLDASTVAFLTDHPRLSALTDDDLFNDLSSAYLVGLLQSHAAGRNIPASARSDLDALVTVLGFLETWVLYDNLVVDQAALESIEKRRRSDAVWKVADGLVSATALRPEITEEAARNVVRYADFLRGSDDSVFSRGAVHGIADYDLGLKDRYFTKISAHLGVSSNSAERAFFYLELARTCGVPLSIHPRKAEYLGKFHESMFQQRMAVYRRLARRVEREFGYEELEIAIPPVADKIVRVAMSQKCCLKTAASSVKEASEVRSLGRLVRSLADPKKARLFNQGRPTERAQSIANDVKCRVRPGGRLSLRRISLGSIPSIGPVLSMIGGGEVTVPDVVLFEPGYKVVFSRWANSALHGLASSEIRRMAGVSERTIQV